MWTALFAITLAAAIGFAVAAICSSPQTGPRRQDRRSPLAEFAAGCRDLSRVACAPIELKSPPVGRASVRARVLDPGNARVARLCTSAMRTPILLPRRMRFMHIDVDEFMRTEPLLYRKLVIRCSQCLDTEQCGRDLSDALVGEEWRDYCPNAPTLSAISTLRSLGIPWPAAADCNAIVDGR